MKFTNISPILSLGFAVMLLLSVSVHPVMAAEATKEQFASFEPGDIEMVTVDELVPDATGTFVTASSADDILEHHSEKAHIRIKDPMADQHSPDVSAFSASSADDEVDAAIPLAIARMDQEGYDLTGQSEHQYQSTIASDKFRALDSRQRALLKSADLDIGSGKSPAVTGQGDVQYYFFTNRTTGATRVMTVSQRIDHEGKPIGERILVLYDDIETSEAIDANEEPSFSASSDIDRKADGAALMSVGISLITLGGILTGISGGAILPVTATLAVIGLFIFVFGWIESKFTPTPTLIPTPTITPRPSSNIVTFGNTAALTQWPMVESYTSVGGASAIRRDGTRDNFIVNGYLSTPNTVWVQSTYGAAIDSEGTIVTWIPGSSSNIYSCGPVRCHKKYLSVSRFSEGDWALAIYEDEHGDSRIEMFYQEVPLDSIFTKQTDEFKAKYPKLYAGWPRDTGWSMISAGKNHALATRSDGRLYAWGENDDHQLDLTSDPDAVFFDIAAGKYFSAALKKAGTGTDLEVLAAGRDDHHQVTGLQNLPPGKYIAIEAGTTRSGVLDHDGTIITKGEPWIGVQPPTGPGHTDFVFGPDYGFALREMAPERHITGPISPEKPLLSTEGPGGDIVPRGSTFEHTHNGVMRIILPDGTVMFWANDNEANQYRFPEGSSFPATVIHYVTPFSMVYAKDNYRASVYKANGPREFPALMNNLNGVPPLMNVNEATWYDELTEDTPPTLPQAVCIDGRCSVGATGKGQLILSDPLLPANGNTLVYSVSENSPHFYRATLSTLGSTSEADTRAMLIQKSRVDPDQPLGFNIITGNGSVGGTNVFVSAQANLTNLSSQMQYTITGTATVPIPEMNIAPQVWKKTDTGDVLVYTGTPKTCSAATTCVAAGDFTPPDAATYYANASVQYTVPKMVNGVAAGTEPYVVMTASAGTASSSVAPLRKDTWQADYSHISYVMGTFVHDTAGLSQYTLYPVVHNAQHQYHQNIHVDADAYAYTFQKNYANWNAIEKTRVTLLYQSGNLDAVADLNTPTQTASGGAPTYTSTDSLSNIATIVVPIAEVVISASVPPLGHVFTIVNLANDLKQATTTVQKNVWTQEWNHMNYGIYPTSETQHFQSIDTYTTLDHPAQVYGGCAAASFTLQDETDFTNNYELYHPSYTLAAKQSFTRAKIDPGVSVFNDVKYTFVPQTNIITWEESMEAF